MRYDLVAGKVLLVMMLSYMHFSWFVTFELDVNI